MRKQRLKVGLAGVMCTPFRGDKEGAFAASGVALEALANALDFELHVVAQGVYTLDQAKAAAAELDAWGADFVLLQASSFAAGEFIYPFAELSARLGLWAIPEGPPTEEGGLPLNSMAAANMYASILGTRVPHYDRPVKWFYGHAGQHQFDERLTVTVRALTALVNLQGARVGLVGGVAPGFDNLIVDPVRLRSRLGIEVVPVSFNTLLRRAQGYDAAGVRAAADHIREGALEVEKGQETALEKSGRVYLACRDLVEELDLDALAISCWPRFQEAYHLAVCTVVGQLNADRLVTACEGDVASAVSMLALHAMSDDVVTLMDLSGIDEAEDRVLLWHCGPTAPQLASDAGVRLGALWLFDGYGGPPMGLRNDLVLRPGPVTVMGIVPDLDRMLVIEGKIAEDAPPYVGSRGWLTDMRVADHPVTVPDLLQTLLGAHYPHHYPLVYGQYAHASLELAAWLGISPIMPRAYTPYLLP